MLIEYPDADERRRMLGLLKGVERRVWVQVGAGARIYAVADEDLERENDDKTSSVHFLRFELGVEARGELRRGGALSMGVDHPSYDVKAEIGAATRAALAGDLA